MLLKAIKLKNFKCYEEQAYNFDLGITSICGENGSGKSSILEAISWILFNYLPYSSNSRIIRNGAKSAEVELTVQSALDKQTYHLKRKTQGVSCSVYNLTQNYLVAEGVSNVQSWVRHQLGLGPNDNLTSICRNGIATPQGNLTIDFTESTENRRKIFDVLLGLDEYKNMYLKLAEVQKLLSDDTVALKLDLARNEGLEEEIESLKLQSTQKQAQLKTEEAKLRDLSLKLDERKTEYNRSKEILEKYRRQLEQKELLEGELRKLEEALGSALEAQREKEHLQELAEKYEKQKSERKVLLEGKKEFDLLSVKAGQLKQLIELESSHLQKAEQEESKVANLASELAEIQASAEGYESFRQKERELESFKIKLVAELAHRDKYKTDIKTCQEEIDNLAKSIAKAEENKNLASELTGLEEKLEKMRSEYNEVQQLEKNRAKTLALLPKPDLLLEVVVSEIELLKKRVLRDEDEKNQLLAQIEFNEDLLPRLTESGVCPILLEPCLNLKNNGAASGTRDSIELRKTQIEVRVKTLAEQISSDQKSLTALQKDAENLQQIAAFDEGLAGRSSLALVETGKSLKSQTEAARAAHAMLQNLPEQFQRQLSLKAKLAETEKLLTELNRKEHELSELQTEHTNLLEKIQALKPLAERANLLRSELQKGDLIKTLIEKHRSRILTAEKDLGETSELLAKLADAPQKLETLEESLERLEPQFLRYNQLLIEVAKLPEISLSVGKVKGALEICKSELDFLEQSGIADETWLQKTEEEIASLQASFNQQAGLCHSLKLILEDLHKRLSEFTGKQNKHEENKTKLQNLLEKERKLAKMRAFYKEMGVRLAKQYTEKIGQRATYLFREIMQDGSYELTWTEDYQITTYKNGRELPFEVLSGGQQTAAAISLRLGLLQELSNIRFAFFDEPTAHLDAERRNQLAMQISAIKSFDQLFVITHDESFAGQANNRIMVTN